VSCGERFVYSSKTAMLAQCELVSGRGRPKAQSVALGDACILTLVLAVILAAVPAVQVQASSGLPRYIDEYSVVEGIPRRH
jgi:hypothetical protein